MKIGRGTIAICGHGIMGVITKDEQQLITYPNGEQAHAWVGIAIRSGKPWSSRKPKIVGHASE